MFHEGYYKLVKNCKIKKICNFSRLKKWKHRSEGKESVRNSSCVIIFVEQRNSEIVKITDFEHTVFLKVL